MKKLSIILGLLLFCNTSVFADEAANEQAQQTFNDNKATVSIQKQPGLDNQKQEVKNNRFCIVIQANWTVKDLPNPDNK